MERSTGCAMSVRAHRPQQSTSLRGEYTSELKLSSVNLGYLRGQKPASLCASHPSLGLVQSAQAYGVHNTQQSCSVDDKLEWTC